MMFPRAISKEEVMKLPLETYKGEIVLITDLKDAEKAISQINKHKVVGFDTEAKPTFRKGQIRKLSLVQIAIPEKVYLFRTHIIGIPDSLHTFLQNTEIAKVGIGLSDDINLIKKLRTFTPNGFLDLNNTFRDLGFESIGARNLAAMVLNIRISKSAQTSNWEAHTLSEKQLRYAATDAWICLELHEKLKH